MAPGIERQDSALYINDGKVHFQFLWYGSLKFFNDLSPEYLGQLYRCSDWV